MSLLPLRKHCPGVTRFAQQGAVTTLKAQLLVTVHRVTTTDLRGTGQWRRPREHPICAKSAPAKVNDASGNDIGFWPAGSMVRRAAPDAPGLCPMHVRVLFSREIEVVEGCESGAGWGMGGEIKHPQVRWLVSVEE